MNEKKNEKKRGHFKFQFGNIRNHKYKLQTTERNLKARKKNSSDGKINAHAISCDITLENFCFNRQNKKMQIKTA